MSHLHPPSYPPSSPSILPSIFVNAANTHNNKQCVIRRFRSHQASRGSTYFSRIASEEARAFSTNPAPLSLSSSANPGLTSGDSLILYHVADPFSPLPSLPS